VRVCTQKKIFFLNAITNSWTLIGDSIYDPATGTVSANVTYAVANLPGFSWTFAVMLDSREHDSYITGSPTTTTAAAPIPPGSTPVLASEGIPINVIVATGLGILVVALGLVLLLVRTRGRKKEAILPTSGIQPLGFPFQQQQQQWVNPPPAYFQPPVRPQRGMIGQAPAPSLDSLFKAAGVPVNVQHNEHNALKLHVM
jgi:hypothetical protein